MMESLPFSGLCDAGATPLALLPVQPANTCDFTHRFRSFPPKRACRNDVHAYSRPAGPENRPFRPCAGTVQSTRQVIWRFTRRRAIPAHLGGTL